MNVWSPPPVIPGDARPSRARERILAVTREMLAEGSFDSLSLEAVASAAGVTRRTVYNQFADKAELYLCRVQEGPRRLRQGYRQGRGGGGADRRRQRHGSGAS